jgi:flagellar motor switch/type III secretory pathway protein FliN
MLTLDDAAEILAACQANAGAVGKTLGRALGVEMRVTPGEVETGMAAELAGPGLLIVLGVGGSAAVLAIPQSSGLLPDWCRAPDATGASKLATLAQELSLLLLPERLVAEECSATYVSDLPAALARGQLPTECGHLPLTIVGGGQESRASLLWPIDQPALLADPLPSAAASPPAAPFTETLESATPELPNYTRSLLKIEVPIVVTLARSKQPLSRIVELAPGSIIPFDKSCDDTLTLEVNNREVASGEAVKVGEKFGLRITSMVLPPERFVPLRGRRPGS